MSWDQVYRDAESVWGEKPDLLLMDIAPSVPEGRVLDLGMGEGRNGMFYALRGHEVMGIDKSSAAVARCRERALSLKIPFQAEVGDIRQVEIEPDSLALAICAMSLQFMMQSESERIIRSLKRGVKRDGMIYITVFSTDDPAFARLKGTRPEVEKHTFFIEPQDTCVHFFEKDELLSALDGLELHHFAQATFLESGHPGSEMPHYHGTLTYIGQRA